MSLRPRDRVAIAVVAIFALVGAYYLLALKPERQQARSLEAQIATQRQSLAQAQQSYSAGRAARASLLSDGPEWAALKLAVPEQSDIPALLRTLEQSAKAVHVTMQAISLTAPGGSPAGASGTPATTSTPGTGSTSTTPAATPATPGTGSTPTTPAATPVPIQLTFDGGYTALNKLVRKLTGLVAMSAGKVHATGPLLSINSVSLSGTSSLTGNLTATIYQLAVPAGTTTGGQG